MRTFLISLLVLAAAAPSLIAQDDPPPLPKLRSIEELEEQVLRLDRVDRETTRAIAKTDFAMSIAMYVAMAAACGFALLTAVFCSVWAQDHGRSGLLWFLIGLLFHILALFLVLILNPNKKNYSPGS